MEGRKANAVADLRDRIRRLFEYLRRFDELGSETRRNLDGVEWKLSLADLPRSAAIQSRLGASDEEATDGVILSVRQTRLSDCPEPPLILRNWLLDGWQDPFRSADVQMKRAHSDGLVDQFIDDLARQRAWDQWLAIRTAWTEAEKPAREAKAVFDDGLAVWARLQRDGENVRLLLGEGHLVYKPPDGCAIIRHPLLLQEIELRFDQASTQLQFVRVEGLPFLYSDLLSVISSLDGDRRRLCRELVDRAADLGTLNLLGGPDLDALLKNLAAILGISDEVIQFGVDLIPSENGRLYREPVLFLVPRPTGLRGAIDAFLEKLPGLESFPIGVELAVSGHPEVEAAQVVETFEERVFEFWDTDLYFTKPANEAQVQIARRLAATGAVLVQGPPGTGKTHTIANLIGHLLAQGKSVLVAAEKSKALRVLRSQVVPELQSLCVSVLDSDRESRDELKQAVRGIASRLMSGANVFERAAERYGQERTELLKRLELKQRDLRTAIAAEVEDIVIAGRGFHPSEAARRVAQEGSEQGWLPGPLTPGLPLPLSLEDCARLYRLCWEISPEDKAEITRGLPEKTQLLPPQAFEAVVRTISEPMPTAPEVKFHLKKLLASVSTADLRQLASCLHEIVESFQQAGNWKHVLANAALLGTPHDAPWRSVAEFIETAATEIAGLKKALLDHDVEMSPERDLSARLEAAEEMLAHALGGGGFGFFSLIGKASWKLIVRECAVNGQKPRSISQIQAVRDQLRLNLLREQLRRRWDKTLAPAGLPLTADEHRYPEEAALARLPELLAWLSWPTSVWAPAEAQLRKLGVPWVAFHVQTETKPPNAEVRRIARAIQDIVLPCIEWVLEERSREALTAPLRQSIECLQRRKEARAAAEALSALEGRSPERYQVAFDELRRLRLIQGRLAERSLLFSKLEPSAPEWVSRMRLRSGVHTGPDLPGDPERAWLYRQLVQELDRRSNLDPDSLQREVSQLKDRLQIVTRTLVENLAWASQCRRTRPAEHRALTSWVELVGKIGKGTGRGAPELERAARKQLDIARGAVPVWIMPLVRIAQSFVPGNKLFDVVILDEASQCGLASLVAFTLGKQVIVVGDDEQVTPIDMQRRLESVRALQDEWLDGFSDKRLFDGQDSAYAIAHRSFPGGLIRLIEHFRCVPDIIAFSNHLSYHGEIRPIRESASAGVFPPVIAHRVAGGTRSTGKLNYVEALEVASLMVAASEHPDYRHSELGAMSLLGDEQARAIDSLLRRYLDPAVYTQRRVLCGTAAHFQGDERHVVFLSMVDSSEGDGPLRKSDRADMKKRYNVAASRAKDQLWVVYSVDPEMDLKPGDLRRELLTHALAPTAWRHLIEKEHKTESEFERLVFRELVEKGYRVTPQVEVGAYRLDLVVDGTLGRAAIECDGERFHTLENLDRDLQRQSILERLGWRFVRIRGSAFFRDRASEVARVTRRLGELGIDPLGAVANEAGTTRKMETQEEIVRRASELRLEWLNSYDSIEELFAFASGSKPKGRRSRWTSADVGTAESTSRAETQVRAGAKANALPPPADADSLGGTDRIGIPQPKQQMSEHQARHVGNDRPRFDPLGETVRQLMPPSAAVCDVCGGARRLYFGERAPFLKCENPSCGKRASLSLGLLRAAMGQLGAKCDCGSPVRVVQVSTAEPFVGCSAHPNCKKTYPWKVIQQRLSFAS